MDLRNVYKKKSAISFHWKYVVFYQYVIIHFTDVMQWWFLVLFWYSIDLTFSCCCNILGMLLHINSTVNIQLICLFKCGNKSCYQHWPGSKIKITELMLFRKDHSVLTCYVFISSKHIFRLRLLFFNVYLKIIK